MKTLEPLPQNIQVAVDSVIFTVRQGQLMALLIQMKKKPFTGLWAFPGGLLHPRETSEHAARRILKDSTGISEVYLEQLATFDDLKRDPAGRVISIAYFALVSPHGPRLQTNEKYRDVRWWSVNALPKLAYDHSGIAALAKDRLRSKLEYSNIAWGLLPSEFPLTQLQSLYEIILGCSLDKRNFRRKILSLGLVVSTQKKQKGASHRPAALFRFKQHHLVYMDIL